MHGHTEINNSLKLTSVSSGPAPDENVDGAPAGRGGLDELICSANGISVYRIDTGRAGFRPLWAARHGCQPTPSPGV